MFNDYLLTYKTALSKVLEFGGRSTRKEYWTFTLVNWLVLILIGQVITSEVVIGFLVFAYIAPCLAITMRRLHDSNKSAWWLLINVIPYIGAFTIFIFMLLDGNREPNRYGDTGTCEEYLARKAHDFNKTQI